MIGSTPGCPERVGTHPRRGLSALLVVLVCALMCVACGGAADPRPGGPVVQTQDGRVRGLMVGATNEFLGVPYAAPPVGRLRWAPPQPVAHWSGIRAMTAPAPRCAQRASDVHQASVSENCLHLSVYRPRGTTTSDRLPVLFWIHGGALTSGSSSQHDGALLADTDHIEVVSIDYRLGPFGFLDLPGLPGGAAVSGDYGLLDQEAALKWTHANIAGFGGNPSAITIAGESAGAYSVCALLTSPPVQGLFIRAIMQSGSCRSQSPALAQRRALQFARGAGCIDPARMVRCLRGRSSRQLLADRFDPPGRVPIAGGQALPAAPAGQIVRGDFAHVPILLGTNRNEARLFSKRFARVPHAGYVRLIRAGYGAEAGAVLAAYPWRAFPEPYRTAYALGAVWTDSGFVLGIGGCAEQHLAGEFARSTPTWFYEFDDRSAPATDRKLPGYRMGAAHTMELPYMWPSYDDGTPYAELTPAQRALSRWMVRYWGAFIRSGDPAVPGQPDWPSYSRTGELMSLREGHTSTAIPTARFSAEHRCGFWDALPGEPR